VLLANTFMKWKNIVAGHLLLQVPTYVAQSWSQVSTLPFVVLSFIICGLMAYAELSSSLAS
jgi:hypothetical protein